MPAGQTNGPLAGLPTTTVGAGAGNGGDFVSVVDGGATMTVGSGSGMLVGAPVGALVGALVGAVVGVLVGTVVGAVVGAVVVVGVGDVVGFGEVVGFGVVVGLGGGSGGRGTQRDVPLPSVCSTLPAGQSHFFVDAFGLPPAPHWNSVAAGTAEAASTTTDAMDAIVTRTAAAGRRMGKG
jgi:hypothetical protein